MFYINKTKNYIKKKIHPFILMIIDEFIISLKKFILKDKRFIYKSNTDLPTKIRIDACNFCQLNCVQCPTKTLDEKIKKYDGYGYLKFEKFKLFVDKNPQIKEIELSNNGEIFLNPELGNIIKYAYKKNIILYAKNGVNLNNLSEEMAETLVKYNFKKMVISIDAATPETYTIYQKGGDFNKVIHNIKTINKYKELYKSSYPILVYKFIVFGHNEHEIPLAKEIANNLNMKIMFHLNWNENYSPIKNRDYIEKETGLHLSKKITDCEKLIIDEYKKREKSHGFHCEYLFKSPQIDWNGRFLGCCSNFDENFGGNVFEEGLLKVLNNDKVVYAKKMLTNFDIPPREDIPCSKCHLYLELKENNCEIRE